jgi:hypothetical protein
LIGIGEFGTISKVNQISQSESDQKATSPQQERLGNRIGATGASEEPEKSYEQRSQ